MLQHWQRLVGAALTLAVPLAAGAARGAEQTPPAKTVKATAQTKKPGAKAASKPHHQHAHAQVARHQPPAPSPTDRMRQLEVPQAKNLAETPDVVLNTKVRAALIAKLRAANAEEIVPETAKGVVTLTGSVKSKALSAQAEQVARKVYGVRGVKNQLKVK